MTNSIQQGIIDDIVTALADVQSTVAASGYPSIRYNTTLIPSRLMPGVGTQVADGNAFVHCPVQQLQSPGPQETQQDTLWHMTVHIELTATNQGDAVPVDKRAWLMWADAVVRLCLVGGITHVQYIYATNPECFVEPDAAVAYIESEFTVHYQHAANNPYST